MSAESSVHIVSSLLKPPSTECHAGAGIFRLGSLFFAILEAAVAGDLGGWSRSWPSSHYRDRESLRSSLPVADPTSGLTIVFYLLINSITILQGL